jgi:glycosidase
MLPYIKSLGVNVLYLLPITLIGTDGKKGTLGSPYSIKNPYKLDENLSEPVLNLGCDLEFKALVEAAHLLNMKVVLEFVFRTASLDSELALEHPEWFYWIKSSIHYRMPNSISEHHYGPPIFTDEELKRIKLKVANNDYSNLPPPHKVYREMFTGIPVKVARVDGKIKGVLRNGVEVNIPCAFADWPPDDNQPVWSDVTYLRLYNHKKFNYIAYNTVRMYDNKLMNEMNEVKDLWDNITGIIPYYQDNFSIDGVMIDMGHALPEKLRAQIINNARKKNPNFLFFEENFSLTFNSAITGYNASVGYLPFDEHIPSKMKSFVNLLSEEGSPIPFFATPENHNTPRASSRAGGIEYSKLTWVINCFLSGIPFIHNGYELGQKEPVNTGLGFSRDEQNKYPPSKLPLFSESTLCWESSDEWTCFLRKIISLREYYLDHLENFNKETFIECVTSDESVVSFVRKTNQKNKFILVAGNISEKDRYFSLKLPFKPKGIIDILNSTQLNIKTMEPVFHLRGYGFLIAEVEI